MAHPKNDHRHSRFLQPRRPLQTLYPQVRRHVITPDGLDEGIPSEGSKISLDRKGRRVFSTTQEGSHIRTHPPSPTDGAAVHYRPRFFAILHRHSSPTVLPRS